jgi:transglutaminase-like putative cysteine protease
MRPLSELRPATWVPSLLAALTTWVTLLAWTGFAETPAGYLVPILFGCLLVAVTGMSLRAAHWPALLVLLAQVVVVLGWLHHREVSALALGGWIPTPGSVQGFVDVLGESVAASRGYAAPVPRSVPEFYPLMIVMGSLTAVLVDFLAVGLRRAPLAGLPLLALYTAPVSILDGGVSWLKFAAAALSFLFLIASEEAIRLRHWGHQLVPGGRVFDTQTTSVSSQAVWASARKIGLTATGLAVVVPLFVPTFSATLFGGGSGAGDDGNGDAVSISNPMIDLKRDLTQGEDVELIRTTTDEQEPGYLRITVLDSFDGNAWRPSDRDIPVRQRADGLVSRPPGLDRTVPTQETRATLQVSEDFESRWLPTPYPVSAVRASGDWRYDRTTLDFISAADNQTTAGLTYRLQGLVLSPSAADLASATPAPPSVFSPNTALPRDIPGSVRTLARTVTQGRVSRFEQAVALQQWFRQDGGFRYSLARSAGNGTDDLVRFLGTGSGGRVGYCEQFAASMALMGRSLGIPSRVAVGFLRPEQVARDTYVYSSHDLHAWPEMYFGGVGWVRFEPTPQGRASDVPGYTTQQVPRAQASASTSAPTTAPTLNRIDRQADQAAAASSDSGSWWNRPGVLLTALGLLVLVVLALAPRAYRDLVRRRRWAAAEDPAALGEAGWSEIRDTAVDLGLPFDDRVTLRTAAAGLVRSFGRADGEHDATGRGVDRGPEADPAATAALERMVGLLERARYSRSLPDGGAAAEQVQGDVDACVAAMRAGVSSRRRRRATWLPASLVGRVPAPGRLPRRRGGPRLEPGVDQAV